MEKQIIQTDKAPQAIGSYSQAIRHHDTLYISGQIPIDPKTGEVVRGDIEAQLHRAFSNLQAIAEAAGATLDAALKVNISLTDLSHFDAVNAVMAKYFNAPWPARAAVQVAALPKGVDVEIEAIVGL